MYLEFLDDSKMERDLAEPLKSQTETLCENTNEKFRSYCAGAEPGGKITPSSPGLSSRLP